MNSTLYNAVPSRPLSILVVDNQLSNLNFMRAVFRGKGHLVLEALDGDAALEILRQENVELLVTDVHMPRLSGIALVKKARELNPHLKAVAVTGGGIGAAERQEFEQLGVAALAKPFTPSQLMSCIEGVLGAGANPTQV
jgi:two-component system, cell cycle sensor histidine kinase and response regulator CckA